MRRILLVAVVAAVAWCTPCAASQGFTLLWHAPALFPGSPNQYPGAIYPQYGAPLSASFFGDFNGDGAIDLIHQTTYDNPHMLVVNDVVTGAQIGYIHLLEDDLMGSAKSVASITPSGSLPLILVYYVDAAGSGTMNVAVYKWQPIPAAVEAPTQAGQPVQARPNPFTRNTAVHFDLAAPGRSEVEVFDVTGRLVRKLNGGQLAAGAHQLDWDGNDEDGHSLSAGTYFYRLKVDGSIVGAQKAVMLR